MFYVGKSSVGPSVAGGGVSRLAGWLAGRSEIVDVGTVWEGGGTWQGR